MSAGDVRFPPLLEGQRRPRRLPVPDDGGYLAYGPSPPAADRADPFQQRGNDVLVSARDDLVDELDNRHSAAERIDAALTFGDWADLAAQVQARSLAVAAGTPFPSIAELERKGKVRYLPLTANQIVDLRLEIPELGPSSVPAGTYPSLLRHYPTVGLDADHTISPMARCTGSTEKSCASARARMSSAAATGRLRPRSRRRRASEVGTMAPTMSLAAGATRDRADLRRSDDVPHLRRRPPSEARRCSGYDDAREVHWRWHEFRRIRWQPGNHVSL